MTAINLEIDYVPGINYIDEYFERLLDNGWEVSFNVTGNAYLIEDIGNDFYEENQSTVDLDLDVEILEAWNDEGMIELTPAQEKEIKTEILSYIQ